MSKNSAPDATGTTTTTDVGGGDDAAARLQMTTTRLARRLRREAGAELTPSQLSVIASIHRNGPITLGALADCERVAPPTITRVVAKLEADGLVERRADAEDRRVARVVTTDRGAELMTESRARKVAWLAERLEQLSARDRARIADALDALEHLADLP